MKKWYAVIGDPIHQSMSPFMHDAWFIENQLNASYSPHHIRSEQLEGAVESLKRLGCSGWNVTVPHKSAIIPFLDELDQTAKEMNAVNTVEVLADGRLRGSNTDGAGFVRSMEEQFEATPNLGNVLMIGAGGAARGISFRLLEKGYGPLYIANRTVEKAEALAAQLPNATALSIDEAEKKLQDFDLIVQTTSVGMNFADAGMPLDPVTVKEGAIVADIIYNPLETQFLRLARENGAKTMNGVGMFVHQGALAFEKWTDTKPNTKTMIEKITATLGGTYVNR